MKIPATIIVPETPEAEPIDPPDWRKDPSISHVGLLTPNWMTPPLLICWPITVKFEVEDANVKVPAFWERIPVFPIIRVDEQLQTPLDIVIFAFNNVNCWFWANVPPEIEIVPAQTTAEVGENVNVPAKTFKDPVGGVIAFEIVNNPELLITPVNVNKALTTTDTPVWTFIIPESDKGELNVVVPEISTLKTPPVNVVTLLTKVTPTKELWIPIPVTV